MGRQIKVFTDSSLLEYDKGGFDDWCVYLTRPNMLRYAPKDTQYFQDLCSLASRHGHERVYADFVKVYDHTTKSLDQKVLEAITRLCSRYDGDSLLADITLSTIYAGMVAEENKLHTKLGKRVKRLGIHQVLVEDLRPESASVFSKGMKWRELDTLMKSKGF